MGGNSLMRVTPSCKGWTGGWCMWCLSIEYWLKDLKGRRLENPLTPRQTWEDPDIDGWGKDLVRAGEEYEAQPPTTLKSPSDPSLLADG
ncbi:uncharacterized protein An02g11770 [Aspergillus niger]|uniref:Contig An02c0370, genomic contig n=2 Tax=Aspergillus niger TaxID=5061 RepID=A2QEP4_ASPNC|nr:uncharacterized protein An02g11770 [Aspergillus niger]CAK37878.1 unnamed protein product [Aspergillus niger]